MNGNAPAMGIDVFYGIDSGAVVQLPRAASGYSQDGDGQWQGMAVEMYGSASGIEVSVNGVMVAFSYSEDGRTATAEVPEGTVPEDIAVKIGGIDVSRGYSRIVEGTTATVALLNPYEVPKEDGMPDEPWTELPSGRIMMNVTIVPGLYYAAASAATIDELKCPGALSPATPETTLIVEKPESETQGYFMVWVSDSPIDAE